MLTSFSERQSCCCSLIVLYFYLVLISAFFLVTVSLMKVVKSTLAECCLSGKKGLFMKTMCQNNLGKHCVSILCVYENSVSCLRSQRNNISVCFHLDGDRKVRKRTYEQIKVDENNCSPRSSPTDPPQVKEHLQNSVFANVLIQIIQLLLFFSGSLLFFLISYFL